MNQPQFDPAAIAAFDQDMAELNRRLDVVHEQFARAVAEHGGTYATAEMYGAIVKGLRTGGTTTPEIVVGVLVASIVRTNRAAT